MPRVASDVVLVDLVLVLLLVYQALELDLEGLVLPFVLLLLVPSLPLLPLLALPLQASLLLLAPLLVFLVPLALQMLALELALLCKGDGGVGSLLLFRQPLRAVRHRPRLRPTERRSAISGSSPLRGVFGLRSGGRLMLLLHDRCVPQRTSRCGGSCRLRSLLLLRLRME